MNILRTLLLMWAILLMMDINAGQFAGRWQGLVARTVAVAMLYFAIRRKD